MPSDHPDDPIPWVVATTIASAVIDKLERSGIGHWAPAALEMSFTSSPVPEYEAACEAFVAALGVLCQQHGFAFETHRAILRSALLERTASATAAKTLLRMLASHIVAHTGDPEAASAAIASLAAHDE